MGNLALGRRVLTQTVCGNNGTELYCSYADPDANLACGAAKCAKCNAGLPLLSHLAGAMSDSSFRHPNTWWQSAEGAESETVQLDLEAEFYFTHLIVVFRSPRPAAMTLERSQDFGRTWRMLQYYAGNCSHAFGLEEGKAGAGRDGATCTSKYSGAYPCNRGEREPGQTPTSSPWTTAAVLVASGSGRHGDGKHHKGIFNLKDVQGPDRVIYRTLPRWESLDPFGTEGQQQLRVTNVRVRLLKRQPCPCRAKDRAAAAAERGEALPTQHFAIYDLIVKGSCFCNGHAEQCVPATGYQPIRDRTNHVFDCIRYGKSLLDRPSRRYLRPPERRPAACRERSVNTRSQCKCNGHARSCRFDWSAWRESGQRSGGACDCLHNTEGRQCQRCKAGFYRDAQRPQTAPDSCKPCNCHPLGSMAFHLADGSPCDPSNGNCICKPGVGGAHCDRCMVGYWGFHEYGCRPCDCAGDCDPFTGDCMFGSDLDLHNLEGNSKKCECKEQALTNSKLFCTMNYAYVLKVKVLSAHDKGSHAEVEVKVQKVLSQTTKVKILQSRVTLYPESWTARGCTCPILNPGVEYLVAGHSDRKQGRLLVNMKSFVKPWKASLGRKVLTLLKKHCNW
ncbi:hypothetical protein F2P81_018984 [Scophthalmus maximus]|uniref:Netrin-4 n=1 Tax=Scophthalmus maximus TaxID=52904 RepID=A0A6A4SB77_SCOMX|nr:hypothetical protein F2P81_018984 [Scophthalmus maximus]